MSICWKFQVYITTFYDCLYLWPNLTFPQCCKVQSLRYQLMKCLLLFFRTIKQVSSLSILSFSIFTDNTSFWGPMQELLFMLLITWKFKKRLVLNMGYYEMFYHIIWHPSIPLSLRIHAIVVSLVNTVIRILQKFITNKL